MKIYILMLLFVVNFGECSKNREHLDANVKKIRSNTNLSAKNFSFAGNKSISKINLNAESFRVDAYEDDELVARYLYDKGLLQEGISYNVQTKEQELITKYYYKENGEYDQLEVTKGKNKVLEQFYNKLGRDYYFQYEFLQSKNIKLPVAAEILSSEVRDLSNVLSVADKYNDFKKEAEINGNQTTIRFIGFNKNIRFYPSTITLFIPENTIINDYELILKDNYLQKELYRIFDGELTREYSYDKDKKIVKVIYKFSGAEIQSSLEKRFNFH